MPKSLEIIEVSPHDGIQNEKKPLALHAKLALINHAINTGAARMQVSSFVKPKRIKTRKQLLERFCPVCS